MRTVGVQEARAEFSRLLDEVAQGEEITVAGHGAPVAKLVPLEMRDRHKIREAIDGLREFRKEHRLDGITIRELIEEGQCY